MNKNTSGEHNIYQDGKIVQFVREMNMISGLRFQCEYLLHTLEELLQCESASLFFRDIQGKYKSVYSVNHSESTISFVKTLLEDKPFVEYCLRHKSSVRRTELQNLPVFYSQPAQSGNDDAANYPEIFIPIVFQENLEGIVVIGKKHSGKFTQNDIDLLISIINDIAPVMAKEAELEKQKTRNKELEILNRCIGIMLHTLDIGLIFNDFIKELTNFLEIDWSAVILGEQAEMTVISAYPEEDALWKTGVKIPCAGDEIKKLLQIRQTLIEEDLTAAPAFITSAKLREAGARSIVYIPLIINSSVIGVMLAATRQPKYYTQNHTVFFSELASHIAYPILHSQLYMRAQEEALVDGLTRLYNRRHLDDVLAKEIALHEHYGGVLSLIILDIDSMKKINDKYGHLYGDEIIRKTGKIIRSTIRASDYAFRFGGDEFVVLLPGTKIESAPQVAERISTGLSEVRIGDSGFISASFGFSCWPEDGTKADEIIDAADVMLYRNKNSSVFKHQ